ncbi:acid type B receptor subunit 2 [Seminavis robusta]|uniref:Acid type B receptor subunit 2 n=1 Tax=Seminavis robusta TaxID=568900 RepID=A0A9N8EI76_9STRA|nr:acid type B receptor subunit 2 [Seminavis robusta]|eukprot:Sro994_g229070.1 acid type B receptor subunit 2 (707) ;mRNA; r:27061-29291
MQEGPLKTRLVLLLVCSAVSTVVGLLSDGAGLHHQQGHQDMSISHESTGHRYTTTSLPPPRRTLHQHHNGMDQTGLQLEEISHSSTSSQSSLSSTSTSNPLTFALVTKRCHNPFIDVIAEGCHDAAERLQSHCLYHCPPLYDPTGRLQVVLMEELLANHTAGVAPLAGIAVSAINASSLGNVIHRAWEHNIPVVTYDSHAPNTKRLAYIGTDNYFFGTQLAKVLKQVEPNEPGKFAIVSAGAPNLVEREQGVRDHLIKEGWVEVDSSPSDYNANSTLVVQQMHQFAETHADLKAIIPVMGAGMRAPHNQWRDFVKAYHGMLLVVGDAMPNQLELLDRHFCHGLVGQLPYDMGSLSLETLHSFATNPEYETDSFIGTNVLEHLLIPLTLPDHTVDHNLIGQLRFVGYTLFFLVAVMALSFSIWTAINRNARVVKVAQPKFLIMVALGVLIMSAAILPMGFDDNYQDGRAEEVGTNTNPESDDNAQGVAICMSPIWLLTVGFTICFSSLNAKIYRVTVLFESGTRFTRVKNNKGGALLLPLLALLVINCTILTTWTVLDPMHYVRFDEEGTDGWDRPISTFGKCHSDTTADFAVPLAIINGLVLLFANVVAYKARAINEEFAESKYIAMAMASMLQAAISGLPILMVVGQESPQAFYMVSVFMIFVMCSAILLLIFVPKLVLYEQFKRQPASVQRARIAKLIQQSTKS